MGMTFVILAQGSAFWHGSETQNGAAADVVINDLFAYVAFQAALEILEPSDDSLIHELSLTPRFDIALVPLCEYNISLAKIEILFTEPSLLLRSQMSLLICILKFQ